MFGGDYISKIVIRENNVLAIETRTGLYVIAQALKHKTMVFFNLFTRNPLSLTIDLNDTDFLCCVTPTRDFFQKSNIVKLKIQPAADISFYREQNRLAIVGIGMRDNIVVYKGTEDEIEMPHIITGDLRLVDYMYQTIQYLDKQKDRDIIDKYPYKTMGIYGELNERLYLCYRYGRYVEPEKDLILNDNLPLSYKTYFQIISVHGLITEEEWLKLPIEDVLY